MCVFLQPELVGGGAIPVLVGLLQWEACQGIRTHAAEALAHLACTSSPHRQLIARSASACHS